MAVKYEEPEETEMNMTPMIDIVFQLIVFFLLTLKFKSVDHRIESQLPKDRGINVSNQFVDELPLLTIKLCRENLDQAVEQQFTKIRVGQQFTIELPHGQWTGEGQADEARQIEYEKAFEQVKNAIRKIWSDMGNNPEAKGEIKTPAPKGTAVPHGDVIRVLDAFLEVGITDVKFEGAASPLPVSTN